MGPSRVSQCRLAEPGPSRPSTEVKFVDQLICPVVTNARIKFHRVNEDNEYIKNLYIGLEKKIEQESVKRNRVELEQNQFIQDKFNELRAQTVRARLHHLTPSALPGLSPALRVIGR